MRNFWFKIIFLALLFFYCYGLEEEEERINQGNQDFYGDDVGQQIVFSATGVPFPTASKKPLRIAIIGGGAAGASTAYFLRKEFNRRRQESDDSLHEIVLFEAAGRLGGRAEMEFIEYVDCTSFDSCAEVSLGVELGASLFAAANMHLVNATKEFNLTAQPPNQLSDQSKRLGIWDGQQLVFNQDLATAYGKAQFLWRYSAFSGPTYAQKLANDLADKFSRIYDYLEDSAAPFRSIEAMIKSLNLEAFVNVSAHDDLVAKKVNPLFVDEFMGGIVRNTYGQSLRDIHSFGALVALYSGMSSTYSIQGGNSQIFEKMAHSSTDLLELNSKVIKIIKSDSPSTSRRFIIERTNSRNVSITDAFDRVVIAVPNPDIQLVGLDESNVIPPVKYVKVFSTVVVGLPDLFFFGLDSYKTFPTTIFVSASANDTSPFSSFAIKTWINMTLPSEKEGGLSAVVKIFSPVRLDEGVLEEMFVWRTQTMVKEWFAYPYLTVKKSEEVMDQGATTATSFLDWSAPVQLDSDGVFFVNRMEEWISCMETETISARNVANLILKR